MGHTAMDILDALLKGDSEEPTAKLRWREILHPVGDHMATVEKVLEQYWMIRKGMNVTFEWRPVSTE